MVSSALVSIVEIERSIFEVRGKRVMLASDLADLYGVTTKRLNEQVKRNQDRFPPDFMFQLNYQELTALRSQFATLEKGRGQHRKYLPYVFTEHGAVMLANVLSSKRAVQASIQVVRVFVRLREFAITHADLARKINSMERKYDDHFKVVFNTFRQLMAPPVSKKGRIGFRGK